MIKKSIGILVLGACVGFIVGSTVEYVRNLSLDKHYEFEDA